MSMILVAAYLCMSAGVSSQNLIESRSEVAQSARVAMALIIADLRSACPLTKDLPFLGMQRMIGMAQADNLDFATHNYTPRRAHEGDWCEISYFVSKDPQSPNFILWRRRDPTPDPEPLSGGTREEIARGLRGVRFEYFDGYDWYTSWGDPNGHRQQNSFLQPSNLYGMPEAVRITLSFDPSFRSKAVPASEQETTEPPLVFQTVARLELAGRSQRTSFDDSSASGTSNTTGQPSEAAEQRGAR